MVTKIKRKRGALRTGEWYGRGSSWGGPTVEGLEVGPGGIDVSTKGCSRSGEGSHGVRKCVGDRGWLRLTGRRVPVGVLGTRVRLTKYVTVGPETDLLLVGDD